jgi:hypothetical protein
VLYCLDRKCLTRSSMKDYPAPTMILCFFGLCYAAVLA